MFASWKEIEQDTNRSHADLIRLLLFLDTPNAANALHCGGFLIKSRKSEIQLEHVEFCELIMTSQ